MAYEIVVLGAGESGVGAALLANKEGKNVFVSDFGAISNKYKKELLDAKIAFEEGEHSSDILLNAKYVVKSPGIPDQSPVVKMLNEAGIPVISEIEFASQYTNAKFVCITGSNGKTTTTMLCYHILKSAGLNVSMAGNIGTSLARQIVEGTSADIYVLELSSFQLDGMYKFKANIAVLLNITPDHLDRYNNNMEEYIKSKLRIVQNQDSEDYFVYCADDENVSKQLAIKGIETEAKKFPFSYHRKIETGAYRENNALHFNLNNNTMDVDLSDITIKGQHNHYNSMAAGIVAKILNVRKDVIRDSFKSFKGVEHRLEKVATVKGVLFINDSKATNVNSAWYAIESFKNKIIWIAGGTDKGNDYSSIRDIAHDKIKSLVCIGVDNSKLVNEFAGTVPCIKETQNMQDAVDMAYELAEPGDVVLLSPACASFDLFDNYEHRGKLFKQCVKRL